MDPLHAFLKYAESTRVKSHTRTVGNKTVQVDAHSRDVGEDRATELKARQARELLLWKKWNDGGQQVADLRPLLASFKPVIKATPTSTGTLGFRQARRRLSSKYSMLRR